MERETTFQPGTGPGGAFGRWPTYDLPLDELRAYAPALAEPADFDAFWQETLARARLPSSTLSLRRSIAVS